MLLEGKSLYIFHLRGLLSSLPLDTTGSALSPWRLYLQQKACSRQNSQTKEGTLELGKYQETGLAIRVKWQGLRGPSLQGPQDSWGSARRGSLCPAFPGAVEPAQMHFPLSMQTDAVHPSSIHVLLPGEEDKVACFSCTNTLLWCGL